MKFERRFDLSYYRLKPVILTKSVGEGGDEMLPSFNALLSTEYQIALIFAKHLVD